MPETRWLTARQELLANAWFWWIPGDPFELRSHVEHWDTRIRRVSTMPFYEAC